MDDTRDLEALSSIYLNVIMRYKSYIEEQEHISVSELPTLVTPKNPIVLLKAEEIKESMRPYSFDHDFYNASIKAFEYVKNDIRAIHLPIEFWLYPEDVIKFGCGDAMDRNVLLCSLLEALGNPSAKVVVTFDGAKNSIANYYEFKDAFYKLSLDDGVAQFSSKDELLRSLGINKDSTAYEFNDQLYRDIS
ncbi:MAG: hypothetical protein QXN59_01055 [Candidatus Micrarchaeaceae archaeon]